MLPSPPGHKFVQHQSLYPGVPTPRESKNYMSHLRLSRKDKDTQPSTKSLENSIVQVTKGFPTPPDDPMPPPPSPSTKSDSQEKEEVENGMDVRFIPPSGKLNILF